MPEIPGAIAGPSNVLLSRFVSNEQTINWYPESTSPGTAKSPKWLRPTPGFTPWADTGTDAASRGQFYQDGRSFWVNGGFFGEIFDTQTTITYGPVDVDTFPASFASNGSAGNQLFITSGGSGYIFDLNTNILTPIADSDFPPNAGQAVFLDGYFLVNERGTRRFYFSALEDGTSWDSLDVAERSIGSDNIISFLTRDRELWLIGSKTTECWYNQGDALNPFAPIQGVFIRLGSSAAYAAVSIGFTLVWVGLNQDGGGIVVVANGYTPDRISTYAIDLQVQDPSGIGGGDLSTSVAFAQQDQGHQFYWLQFRNNTMTPVFDLTEGLWHQRALWNTTTAEWEPHLAVSHSYSFNFHLVGSALDGIIYQLSYNAYTDGFV